MIRSRKGAWIEIVISLLLSNIAVRSRKGAWIEIKKRIKRLN